MISTDASTWRFMVLYSPSVNFPVLFSMFSGIPIFPISWKQGRLLKNLLVFLAGFQGLSHGMA